MSNQGISRREFMGRTVGGAAAAGLGLGAPALGRAVSPNEKITVGVIGAGIRGLEDMQSLLNAGANVAMVCDLYDGHLRRALEIQANTPTTRDYRKVLERKDIDAVLIATSDHWHMPVAVEAMKAGKDVYCEKPMAHTIPEALEMVKVSKATGRVVQVGSQSLSMQSTTWGKQHLDAGDIGKVFMVQCEIYRPDPVGAWKYPVPARRHAANRRLGALPGQRAQAAFRRRALLPVPQLVGLRHGHRGRRVRSPALARPLPDEHPISAERRRQWRYLQVDGRPRSARHPQHPLRLRRFPGGGDGESGLQLGWRRDCPLYGGQRYHRPHRGVCPVQAL